MTVYPFGISATDYRTPNDDTSAHGNYHSGNPHTDHKTNTADHTHHTVPYDARLRNLPSVCKPNDHTRPSSVVAVACYLNHCLNRYLSLNRYPSHYRCCCYLACSSTNYDRIPQEHPNPNASNTSLDRRTSCSFHRLNNLNSLSPNHCPNHCRRYQNCVSYVVYIPKRECRNRPYCHYE